MTLADHLRAIVRYWYAVVLLLVIGVVAAILAVSASPASYQSTARLAIGPTASVTDSTPTQVVTSLQNVAVPATLVELASSDTLKKSAIAQAGVGSSGVSTSAAVANNSSVVQISVRSGTAGDAVKVATALAQQAASQFEKIYPTFSVTTIDAPSAAKSTRPSITTTALLGGALGLVLGYLIALALTSLARDGGLSRDGGRRRKAAHAEGHVDPGTRARDSAVSEPDDYDAGGGRQL